MFFVGLELNLSPEDSIASANNRMYCDCPARVEAEVPYAGDSLIDYLSLSSRHQAICVGV
jgi:hypothetical protein